MANVREIFSVFFLDLSDWVKAFVDTQLRFIESATVKSRARLTGAALHGSVFSF
jgi:hypothetical protein